MEGQQRLLQALIDLELALGHISNDVFNLKLGLQSLLQTYVTPMILSDDRLLGILHDASVRPPGLVFSCRNLVFGFV